MKRITLVTVLLLALLTCFFSFTACDKGEEPEPVDTTITVVSYNIRLFTVPSNLNDWWLDRKPVIFEHLSELSADLYGFQEVLPNQRDELIAELSDYTHVGVGREDGEELGESSSIFFRTSRFELLDSGNFWLSETPETPTFGWDAECLRICTWVLLKDKLSGETFSYFNTHLDHVGTRARTESAKLMASRASEKECPTIVTGDFNADESSDVYTTMTELFDDTKSIAASTEDVITYNSWGNVLGQCVIDYCFVSKGDFDVASYDVQEKTYLSPYAEEGEEPDTFYASDHNAVVVKLKLK